jgi:predicted transcriptional regulator
MGETVRIEIPRELYDELKTLAANREEKPERLVAEALRWYVANEGEFLAAVEEGLTDLEAGRIHAHEDVIREFRRRYGTRR